MIHNDPNRIPGSPNARPFFRPTERTDRPNAPAFPRSGWADSGALSRSLQEAIDRMRHDYSQYFNWRRPFDTNPPSNPPVAMPMYGMPNPGGGGGQLPTDPTPPGPPIFAPMYGMPNPGGGGGQLPTEPTQPGPPIFAPMYGMPNPGGGGRGLLPDPTPLGPPTFQPMYGMPNPGGGTGLKNPTPEPPTIQPMYGMPNP